MGARWQKQIFRKLKLPLDKLSYVEKLVRLHQRPMALVDEEATDSAYRRLAAQAGNELEDLFIHCKADITTKNEKKVEKYLRNYDRVLSKILEVQENDKLKEFQSPVRGEEIMEICNIKPSRLVGLIKNEIEEAILEGEIPNDYNEAKIYFINHKEKWIKQFS
jgi:tRNA nucleotidyltransferase/poly(A) polymerase